jgi:pyruvate dehydrogenase E2 component (dihydrolipoamide acetyltransferase)
MEVVVPDLGDFSDVEIIEVLVKPGDAVAPEDPLITLETEKATMDVPSPSAGVVKQLKVSQGDRVSSGDLVLVLDEQGHEARADEQPAPAEGPTEETAGAPQGGTERGRPASRGGGQIRTVTVPDLGDFSDVEVIEVLVAEGDRLEAEQGLVTLETEKATMDVPAPFAGTVAELRVKLGDRVSTGDTLLTLRTEGEAEQREEPAPSVAPEPAGTSAPSPAVAPSPERPAAPAPPAPAKLPPIDEQSFSKAHASPSVRKLARELGVDLGRVRGSGLKGRVTADDLKAFVKQVLQGGAAPGAGLPKVPEVEFSRYGEIELQPLTRIQKISGPRLQASWVNIPHVTQHEEADITELEETRQSLKESALERGIRLTPLPFILRACALALEEFPRLKSSLTADGESLVFKRYTHIGVAVDTPDGLIVPVVRDAGRKDIYELARSVVDLSERARGGTLRPEELQGGVFTVSSLGGIGGTSFTPIINAPEVAILGVSRAQRRPVYRDGEFVARLLLPLSLSYDHRVVDGALAARFTTHLAELLGDVGGLTEAIP